MNVLICGDRNWSNRSRLFEVMDSVLDVKIVIHGAAPGADTIGGEWALARGKEVLVFPALWNRYGRAAGPIRNKEMLKKLIEIGGCVYAFHNDIASSKGTKNMITIARRADIIVNLYKC